MYTKFRSKAHKERDKLGYIGVDGRMIVEWIVEERGCEDVVGTHLVEDTVRRRTRVNTVMNVRVHEWLCSVALVS
jgi:hypothetical protein